MFSVLVLPATLLVLALFFGVRTQMHRVWRSCSEIRFCGAFGYQAGAFGYEAGAFGYQGGAFGYELLCESLSIGAQLQRSSRFLFSNP